MNSVNLLNKEKIIIAGLIFLLPLFFLPLTSEFYIFNKQTLLIAAAGLLLIFWAAKMALAKTLSFRPTPLDLPVLLFALAHVIATIFASPNKVQAVMASPSVAAILALTALYFVIVNNLKANSISLLFSSSLASASLLGLIAVYQFIGLGETLIPSGKGIDWLQAKLFTPTGGPLILISFLLVNLLLAVFLFLRKFNRKAWLSTIWFFVASLLIALGLITTVWQILPGKETPLVILPYSESWAIAIEAFKRNPLLGVGPGNYISAFNRFRTIGFNTYDFWNVRFANASSFPLELLTIGGAVTLGTYLFLLLKTVRPWLKTYSGLSDRADSSGLEKRTNDYWQALLIGILALFGVQLLLPINLLTLTLTFLFLALLALSQPKREFSFSSKSASLTALGLVSVLVLASFYFWGRIWMADFHLRRSINALAKNQGIETYNRQTQAIALNPYSPGYRRAYSQTNFALANSLAGQANLSDQDRTNITQLIQQAIREAKVATTLNPTDAANWENLAQIYRDLINFAQGADQWAIAAYRQAIITDPISPRIRLNFGGLFYSLQLYDQAVRYFQDAVELKPNYANGYYNLAAAYREQGKYVEAYNALQLVLNFIPADTADYQKARDELDELAAKLPTEATPSARPAAEEEKVLTEPEPLPSPAISPIPLPEEAGPEIPTPEEVPESEITPTPSP